MAKVACVVMGVTPIVCFKIYFFRFSLRIELIGPKVSITQVRFPPSLLYAREGLLELGIQLYALGNSIQYYKNFVSAKSRIPHPWFPFRRRGFVTGTWISLPPQVSRPVCLPVSSGTHNLLMSKSVHLDLESRFFKNFHACSTAVIGPGRVIFPLVCSG